MLDLSGITASYEIIFYFAKTLDPVVNRQSNNTAGIALEWKKKPFSYYIIITERSFVICSLLNIYVVHVQHSIAGSTSTHTLPHIWRDIQQQQEQKQQNDK